jgi:outer membrane protein OmpA-like peptidoglycan-associated protein
MKCLVPVFLLVTLTGCVNADLRALRKAPPPSDPYLEALSKHYLAFAEEEARNYDWVDVVHFTDKGLRAVYGHDIKPDDPEDRDIEERILPDLEDARRVLLAEMQSDARVQHPDMLARAVFFYDCWLEQQEEGWQEKDIKVCREGYYTAIDGLERSVGVVEPQANAALPLEKKIPSIQGQKVKKTPTAPVSYRAKNGTSKKNKKQVKAELESNNLQKSKDPKPQSKSNEVVKPKLSEMVHEPAPEVTSGRAVLYYKPRSKELYQKSAQTLDAITRKLKGHDGYRITLHGYVGGQKNAQDNLRQSYQQSVQLKKILVAKGLKAENIHVFAFGDAHAKTKGSSALKAQGAERVEMLIE